MQAMAEPYMQYEHPSGAVARWHGGAYIELGYVDGEDFRAEDVINVWDYERDEPTIPRTLDAFRTRVDERLNEEE